MWYRVGLQERGSRRRCGLLRGEAFWKVLGPQGPGAGHLLCAV